MSQSSDYEMIITAFIEYVRPQFVLVVGITPFCACLVTLLVVLFAYSTPSSRRLLVFKLNVLAICIALVTGVLNAYLNSLGVLDPFSPMPSLGICFTFAFFALLSPLFYDSILLQRLLAFYPINSTPMFTVAKVLVLPICVKLGRFVLVTLFLRSYYVGFAEFGPVADWFKNHYITAEWALQVVDNMYSSGFFLYKLHIHSSRISTIRSYGSFRHRIRQIFLISAANFVFPVIFNIGQIICITTDRSYLTTTMLLLVNGYVSVIGVLGATIWTSGTGRAHAHTLIQSRGGGTPGRSHTRSLLSSESTCTPFVDRRALDSSPVYDISQSSPYRIPRDLDSEKGLGNDGGKMTEPAHVTFSRTVFVHKEVYRT